ncbi:hypothetical protein SAMD00019534_104440 [Acytostelium subglobosum LB1]|uniref:hypothetical protein n=1 Tax=Acytostelium subglobosum LB1 TaxID=1410327 RepID=UPI0006451CAB|nr:hypothetical protein SAMD00019534_104440 [Acytostelium subglobosum LB1]GAM27269.1 hypothetical protein SAMD00019534_104440 [Acytostelium subglobosum LB1]|eukprot:XP_012749736.1 hypothetical protein SAMD00019534_104440 [Acytostelium subglobosum LB1]
MGLSTIRLRQFNGIILILVLLGAACIHAQDDDPSTTTKSSTSEDDDGEGCPPPFVANMGETDAIDPMTDVPGKLSYDACDLKSSLMSYGTDGEDTVLTLSIDSCKTSECRTKYACSEAHVGKTGFPFGNFSCTIKASSVPGTVTTCYATDGHMNGESSMYFIVDGSNETHPVRFGVKSKGKIVSETVKAIPGLDTVTRYNTFKIAWGVSRVDFYVNNATIGTQANYIHSNTEVSWLDLPKVGYYISHHIDSQRLLGPVPELPSVSYIKAITVTPDVEYCDSVSSEDRWHWGASPPLQYFTSNCTNWRPEWIYNDSIQEPWRDESLSFHNNQSSDMTHRGKYAFQFDLKPNTQIYFKNKTPFLRNKYKFLSFWINGAAFAGQQLQVWATSNRTKVGSVSLNDYIRGGMQMNTWYHVHIPLRKFQVNPPSIKTFDGFLFTEVVKEYTGIIYLDDIQLNNGSVCMHDLQSIYKKGKLSDSVASYSYGSIDLKNTEVRFQEGQTLSWVVHPSSKVVLKFKNDTGNDDSYDGIVLALYYAPNSRFQYPNGDQGDAPPRQLQANIALTVEGTGPVQPLGLAEYVGGEFPVNQWMTLLIPLYDFGIWEGAKIDGMRFGSDINEIQGTFYIGRVDKAKWVDAPHDEDSASTRLTATSPLLMLLGTLIMVTLQLLI